MNSPFTREALRLEEDGQRVHLISGGEPLSLESAELPVYQESGLVHLDITNGRNDRTRLFLLLVIGEVFSRALCRLVWL
jgi:hypothetical protein